MPNIARAVPWAPPAALVAQVEAGDVVDMDALMAWWLAASTPAWLRTMPADIAVKMAAAGIPDPKTWTGIQSSCSR